MGKIQRPTLWKGRADGISGGSLLRAEVRALLGIGLGAAIFAGAWAVYAASSSSAPVSDAGRDLVRATASSSESLLLGGNLSQLRRHISSVGLLESVESSSITLPDGSVLAHSSPGSVTLSDAPPTWEGAPAPASETLDRNTGLLRILTPLQITGRGSAALEVVLRPGAPRAPNASLIVGEGAIAGLAMIGVLVVIGRAKTRVRAILAVRGALLDVGRGERTREALLVDERFGAEARAWGTLLGELDALRAARADEAVTEALETGGVSGGALGEAFDALWQGVMILDEGGSVMYANGAAGVMLQTRREALVGSPVSSIIQNQEALDAVQGVLRGRDSGRHVVEIDRSSGSEGSGGSDEGGESGGVLRVSLRTLGGEDGSAALVLIEDVTQQRVADKARNAFVANATHELRTPLTNIRLYVEEALDADGDEALRAKALNVINSEARRLERIVSDMLSVSEIEAGSMTLREADVRTDALFEELERDFEASAKEKEIELKFDLPPKMPVLTGDRDKIAMALHNLVGNAIKYTPAGGEVVVKVEEADGHFRVEVKDNGIGISEEDSQRVFEKFYRARDKRIKHVTGSGIGLALAREVVRLHGGDISVESEIDEGSRFTMSLPTLAHAA